ncbi:MAG: cell surface protein SprA [Bacteroidota bacterium]|nr:cell surface protein SprA [Bacteroidota bacterium]
MSLNKISVLKGGFLSVTISLILAGASAAVPSGSNSVHSYMVNARQPGMSNKSALPVDSPKLKYKISKDGNKNRTGIDLLPPPAIEEKYELDESLEKYIKKTKIGEEEIADPEEIGYDDYQKQQNRQFVKDYFRRRSFSQSNVNGNNQGMLDKLNLGNLGLNSNIASLVDIRPTGSAELIFSMDFNRVQNPTFSVREQRNNQFKFDQKIQFNVTGSIGDKIKLGINYDTQAAFDFENQKRINYEGKEDEIVRSVQVGDIAMPTGGSLISGSNSMFGVKTRLQFGKLDFTAVYAQAKSERKEITLDGGAQRTKFSIIADNYDVNRHFFLAHYFRDNYDKWNANWPAINNVQITRVEVWITNTSIATNNTRSVVGFQDLGEGINTFNKNFITATGNFYANNASNNLYDKLKVNDNFRLEKTSPQALNNLAGQPNNFENTTDYYIISNARQLSTADYTINAKLGYISLNQQLGPNEAMAVAFEYTVDGVVKKVGEFARDIAPDANKPNVLYLKLLKSVILRPQLPIYDLMMKNIYSLNAYQVQAKDFRLQVLYVNDRTGTRLNYIPQEPTEPQLNGVPLISVLNLDKLNTQLELKPDGNFDYLEGITVLSQNGKIIFPEIEPFGNFIRSKFNDSTVGNKYAFQELYDSTRTAAIQVAQKNRYYLEGYYQSSNNSVISLNAINVPQGSVKVFANGAPLSENVDYSVDYSSGNVTILNQALLNSGAVLKVEAESNNLFNIQQKTMMGFRSEYTVNPDLVLGSTLFYLRERPLTPKSTIGDEPIRNLIVGSDLRFRTDSRLITRIVDALPFLETKEKSEVVVTGEVAYLHPGHPQLTNDATDANKGGVSYLDDFEGTLVPYDLRLGGQWVLASAPRGNSKFPEANLSNDLRYGYKRAKLSWYIIDNIFFRETTVTPDNIRGNNTILSDHYQREVSELEVFPNRQIPNGSPGTAQTFDLHYFPAERGPYNFSLNVQQDGTLNNPSANWAGIMRKIDYSDFEAFNIEYVEFWMLDPFIKDKGINGELYINLGNISEDILRDERKGYENGLPTTGTPINVDTTKWGRIPNALQINNAFSTIDGAREFQDVGYDGLKDDDERTFFDSFLTNIRPLVDGSVYDKLAKDPSTDDFLFYRADDYDQAKADILQRYRDYNNTEGNTPQSIGGNNGAGTQFPDDEDINRDLNLEKSEDYYEYKVKVNANDFAVGSNYITDKQTQTVTLRNGKKESVNWYQFKIPVRQFDSKVGSLNDFRSIRFIRMYMTGFDKEVITRFARFQLIRGDWRKYLYSLEQPGDNTAQDTASADLVLQAVNFEENGKRPGIPYVIPPGIQRTTDFSTPNLVQQNEQALSLKLCDLKDGDGRAIFKNTNFDVRLYKRLKMFIHAEATNGSGLRTGQLHAFVRLGNDFNANYYEYDIPLEVTRVGSKDASDIWPEANRIDLVLGNLTAAKAERDALRWPNNLPYVYNIPGGEKGTITLLGTPNLGNVRTIMIGLRNPKDDGLSLPCAEVWVNELRVADFDEKGGWAATGRVLVKAADFARMEVTGSRRTIGFGGLEQTVQQRSQEDARSLGFTSSFELGKFLPSKYNIRVPMYFSINDAVNTPRYNPIAPDVELSRYRSANKEDPTYDSLLNVVTDYTRHKSLNFTGVQKSRSLGSTRKPRPWDVENLNATYIYNEIYKRNVNNVYDIEKTYSGQLSYGYNWNTQPWTPFAKIGKSKWLKPIRDFNLFYAPQNLTVTARADRVFGEKLYRNVDDFQTVTAPQYNKSFLIGRRYDFRHNVSKGFRITYNATLQSRVEEPVGKLDEQAKLDSVKFNFWQGGKLSNFQQNLDLTWELPLNKIPALEFLTVTANYKGAYEWRTAAPAALNLGNTIQNGQTRTLTSSVNMAQIYNKSEYLRTINAWRSNKGRPTKTQDKVEPKLVEKKKTTKKKSKRRKKRKPVSKPKVNLQQEEPSEEFDEEQPLSATEQLVALLLSVKTGTFSYSFNEGQLVPGFKPIAQLIGNDFALQRQDKQQVYANAPGIPFVFGLVDENFRRTAADKGWIVTDTNLSTQYNYNKRINIAGNLMLEPIHNLRITLDISKQSTSSLSENFRFDARTNSFRSLSTIESGNYSISYLPINTSFQRPRDDGNSATFQNFEDNRIAVARELQRANPNASSSGVNTATGFPKGYGPYSQDVLLPAFVSAYSGKSSGNSPFINMPAPNWRVSYTGLSNFKPIKKKLKAMTISHAYRGTYSVDGYRTALDFDPTAVPQDTNDLISKYNIDRVTISERFEPLIGFDAQFSGNWTGRAEYKKDRTLSLSFVDRRLTEIRGTELSIGAGYRTTNLVLPRFGRRSKQYVLTNDFTFRLDMSIRDQKQLIRILDNSNTVSSGGQYTLSLTPNIQYVLSKSLTLNIFYRHNKTKPYTSNSFPTSFTSVGFSIQYLFAP